MSNAEDLNFRLGCAVWAYKDWVGDFYPAKSRASDFLRLYGERMTTVEGNTTFYSIPTPEVVQRWAHETPTTFRFCPKLPRQLTHAGALTPNLPAAIRFLSLMQGLGPQLGPILVQLPPSYSPAAINDLARFLTGWPRTTSPIAVEVRHIEWFKAPHTHQLNALLTRLGVGRAILDSRTMYEWEEAADDPQLQSERRKPNVPMQPHITAPFTLVRYISHPKLTRNQDYLAGWVEQVKTMAQRRKAGVFFCPLPYRGPIA